MGAPNPLLAQQLKQEASQFNAQTSYTTTHTWLESVDNLAHQQATPAFRVQTRCIASHNTRNKINYLDSLLTTTPDLAGWKACVTVSTGARILKKTAPYGLAIVTSDMQNVTGTGTVWHAVAIHQVGNSLFIFDPAFNHHTHHDKTRLGDITGICVVEKVP